MFDDDDIFFTDFGVDVYYQPQDGAVKRIRGLFDKAYSTIEMLSHGVGVESTAPVVLVKSSDVVRVKHGETVVIDGTTYWVVGVQPDGSGLTRLLLSEESGV